MNILFSNDDGVHAKSLYLLKQKFSTWGTGVIVAPETEKSTTGHSLTLHKPLRVKKLQPDVFSVSGFPADCVFLAVDQLMKRKPDLVISGINLGANLGQDLYYSGTIAAAREAVVAGIPAIAFSLCKDERLQGQTLFVDDAATICEAITREIILSLGKTLSSGLKKWPSGLHFNVNIPNLPIKRVKGAVVASSGFRRYSRDVLRRKDARGGDYYWIGGRYLGFSPIKGSDCDWVDKGYVAITPLLLPL